MAPNSSGKATQPRRIAPPKGTRDLYPEDVLRVRYLQKAWRDTAIRHGFDEIEGPTFEQAELYAVKSGDAILGELFQAFSGKDASEVEVVARTGRAPFALRPEFTPTLARMYAARAAQLPKPCRWFTAGPYFRAERPQRGRLREFLQWNVDVMGVKEGGDFREQGTAEVVSVCVGLFESLGFSPDAVRIKLGSRQAITSDLRHFGLPDEADEPVLALLDARPKMPADAYLERARVMGLPAPFIEKYHPERRLVVRLDDTIDSLTARYPQFAGEQEEVARSIARQDEAKRTEGSLQNYLVDAGLDGWCEFDSMIVRGLAYYTGTVFEAIADGERAVAGGGRYDNLIELFGGPTTPAVGFGMGDVVLSLLMGDKGLVPEGPALMDAVSARSASVRPEAFVLGANDEASEPIVRGLVAQLRRGVASEAWSDRGGAAWDADRYAVRPLHTRVSSKTTKNLGKLLADGEKQGSRFAVVVHDINKVQLKDLDRREELAHPIRGDFSADPSSEAFVGRAIAERC
ncbi:MAG: ATP phosphoribosyltransferase regulatory subunit [Planctomycetota bacterium]